MTKVFLLFYSKDEGNREDWSVFYTPVEIFSNADARQRRIDQLLKQSLASDEDEMWEEDDFFLVEREINNTTQTEGRPYKERNYD